MTRSTEYARSYRQSENDRLIAELKQLETWYSTEQQYYTSNLLRVARVKLKAYMDLE